MVERFFGDWKPALFSSGTHALAAALLIARRNRPGLREPEVILPAYACPDLISACVLAGVAPKLVDVRPQAWGYDLHSLRNTMSERTVAAVAVNLLGLGDDAQTLHAELRAAGVHLIQDWAQCLPRNAKPWIGDAVVLSFGRGKPLNLLRGGALLQREPASAQPRAETARGARPWLLGTRGAALLFNAATSPWAYGWVSKVSGMSLGVTRYHAPNPLQTLPQGAWGQLGPALVEYGEQKTYDASVWNESLAAWGAYAITPLRCASGPPPNSELLRLPLLAASGAARDRIVHALTGAGLGASSFYATSLPHIADVPPFVAQQGPFAHAQDMAERLFTLPTHRGVTRRVIEAVNATMKAVLS